LARERQRMDLFLTYRQVLLERPGYDLRSLNPELYVILAT
jgi:hypothetical protein